MKLPRFARLLPLVVLAIATLLVLNGTGLLRDGAALAQTSISAAANALTDAPPPSSAGGGWEGLGDGKTWGGGC